MFDINPKREGFRMDGQVDQELPPEVIARIMMDLIDATHDMISGYNGKKLGVVIPYHRAEQAPRKGMKSPGSRIFAGDEDNLFGT